MKTRLNVTLERALTISEIIRKHLDGEGYAAASTIIHMLSDSMKKLQEEIAAFQEYTKKVERESEETAVRCTELIAERDELKASLKPKDTSES